MQYFSKLIVFLYTDYTEQLTPDKPYLDFLQQYL